MALQWPLAVRAGLDPWFCPVQLHALLASHWLNGTAMGFVHTLRLENLLLALHLSDLSVHRARSVFDLSSRCPVSKNYPNICYSLCDSSPIAPADPSASAAAVH